MLVKTKYSNPISGVKKGFYYLTTEDTENAEEEKTPGFFRNHLKLL
jgi:hypothetical protein